MAETKERVKVDAPVNGKVVDATLASMTVDEIKAQYKAALSTAKARDKETANAAIAANLKGALDTLSLEMTALVNAFDAAHTPDRVSAIHVTPTGIMLTTTRRKLT